MLLRIMLMVAALTLAASVPASAQISLEPEMGIRVLTSDAADILGPGFMFGGNVAWNATPVFALVGHGDFSLHVANSDVDLVIDGGATLNLTLGARFMPMGAQKESKIQPYVGVEAGRAGMAWSYTDVAKLVGSPSNDGIGSWIGGINAGLLFRLSDNVDLGAGGSFILQSWSSETSEGFDSSAFSGNQVNLVGRLAIRL